MLWRKGLRRVIRVADTEVTMLTKHKQTLGLLRNGLGHKAHIIVETIDITLIASIEQDRASLRIPVGVIDEVAHFEAGRFAFGVEMIQLRVEEELLWVGVLPVFVTLGSGLGRWEAHSARGDLRRAQQAEHSAAEHEKLVQHIFFIRMNYYKILIGAS